MNSTWRSGECNGYCDLHRRGLELCGIATVFAYTFSDGRRNNVWELGERLRTDGDGVSRGSPLGLARLDVAPDPESVSSDGRYGSVLVIFEEVVRKAKRGLERNAGIGLRRGSSRSSTGTTA